MEGKHFILPFGMATAATTNEDATPEGARDREEIRQLVVFSCFGVGMGILGAVSAWLLYHLINIITGFAYFHRFTTQSPIYPPAHGLG
ncbi:MAG: hypothetical protein ACRDHE_04560, partial [Ktedonobacterales bacterium]